MFNRFIYRREWSFRIYRETLSRFSCAASMVIASKNNCTPPGTSVEVTLARR
ncbi:hypothetical protein ABLN67_13135 [Mycobacterium tuberculosis]